MAKNNINIIFLQYDPIDINIYIYTCIKTTKIIANNKIINNNNNNDDSNFFSLFLNINFRV